MDTNIDFKALWAKQKSEAPGLSDLILKMKRYKNAGLRKLFLLNLMLLGTSAFIALIWYQYQPTLMTTKIGIIIVLLAMLMFLGVYNRMFPDFIKLKHGLNNREYLQQLMKLKNKQQVLQTTALNLYYLLLTLGMWLYFYEYTVGAPLWFGFCVYGTTFVWIAFNWLYTRPKQIKKNEEQLNGLINKFSELIRYMEND